jgi:hypothetical protein
MASQHEEILSVLSGISARVSNIERRIMDEDIVFESVRMMSVEIVKPTFDAENVLRKLRDESLKLMRALSSRYPQVSLEQKMGLVRLVISESVEGATFFEVHPNLLSAVGQHEDMLEVPDAEGATQGWPSNDINAYEARTMTWHGLPSSAFEKWRAQRVEEEKQAANLRQMRRRRRRQMRPATLRRPAPCEREGWLRAETSLRARCPAFFFCFWSLSTNAPLRARCS